MYILSSTSIRSPNKMEVTNDTQVAVQRTLKGSINRDYFGDNKRVWTLDYTNVVKSDYDVINTIYQAYLTTEHVVTFSVTETNYTVTQTNVHVDLSKRSFGVGGDQYLSDFTLVLTEA